MATKRIKDISTTATTFAADDFIALDASSVGTRKMAKASLITQVGANYLEKADNLSDVASKDTSKLNLEVPNVGTAANEVSVNGMLGDLAFQSSAGVTVDDLTVDGQLTAAVGKPMPVNGPTMRFDGVDDAVTFADNDAFSFTNGTDDTPFSVSAWVKAEDFSQFTPIGKWQTAGREWLLYFNSTSTLVLNLRSSGPIDILRTADAATTVNGKWIHVAVSYAGSGPNSSNAFPSAMNGVVFYIDGKPIASTASNNSSYVGMSATVATLTVGNYTSNYTKGEIRDVKLYNKELSLAEVREVYSNGQLPESFAESTGSADVVTDGGFENWTTSTNLTDWIEKASVSVEQSTDKISGSYSCKLTGGGDIGSSGNNWLAETSIAFAANKKYRLTGKVKRFSGSTNTLQFGATYYKIIEFNGTTFFPRTASSELPFIGPVTSKSLGNDWYSFSIDFTTTVANTLTIGVNGSTDPYLVDDVSLVQIGSVLDARAEQFDSSTGKLYDLSGNGFVGTQSGGVSLLGREMPIYQTGTWTPTLKLGGSAVSHSSQSAVFTKVGDTVTYSGVVILSSLDALTGTVTIDGLPYAAKNTSAGQSAVTVGYAANMASLTSAPTGFVGNNESKIYFYHFGSTGAVDLSNTNLTATSQIRFSGTYQIQ